MNMTFRSLMVIVVIVFCQAALAQDYQIRTDGRYNLRAEPNIEGRWIETVASGTVLRVNGASGSWLRISRNGSVVWMADWLSYARVESVDGSQSQIDNCCFVDRQCVSDQEWINGYWAFQNGQCAAPVQTQTQTSTQPVAGTPANVDNCCYVDRQCYSDQDWIDGYYAYQYNQCTASTGSGQGAPVSIAAGKLAWTPIMPEGVRQFLANPSPDPFNNCCQMHHNTCHSAEAWNHGHWQFVNHHCARPAPVPTRPPVEGPPHFIFWMDRAFELIARDAPEWLDYIYKSGLQKIVMLPTAGGSGFANQSWTFEFAYEAGESPDGMPSYDQYYGMTGVLVHEACHAIQQRTYTQTNTVENELTCLEAQIAVLKAIDPGHRWVDAIQWQIDNIYDPSTWWW